VANSLAQEIEKILSDELGEFIARATVKKNCELIGCAPEALTTAQLPELAESISKSVTFFSGEGKGKELADRIRNLKA
jgi:hypothetical protein